MKTLLQLKNLYQSFMLLVRGEIYYGLWNVSIDNLLAVCPSDLPTSGFLFIQLHETTKI